MERVYSGIDSSRKPLFDSLSMHTKRDASPVMLALPAFLFGLQQHSLCFV